MRHPTNPDWNVAILDGNPEVVLNLAAVAEMVRHAPIGEAAAIERLRRSGSFTAEHIQHIESILGSAA